VDDGLAGCLLALLRGKPGEPYNIGCAGPEVSMLGLVDYVALAGHKLEIETVPHPPEYPADEPMRRCPDVIKAKEELGFEATTSLTDGLRRFLCD
jgi:UDP-glucuronate decarboxylase